MKGEINMSKMRMSESCKISMTEQFGFKNAELTQIEDFISAQNKKTVKDALDALMQDNKLDNKQKIIIAYVIGNSARDTAIREGLQKGMQIDMSGDIPPIGG